MSFQFVGPKSLTPANTTGATLGSNVQPAIGSANIPSSVTSMSSAGVTASGDASSIPNRNTFDLKSNTPNVSQPVGLTFGSQPASLPSVRFTSSFGTASTFSTPTTTVSTFNNFTPKTSGTTPIGFSTKTTTAASVAATPPLTSMTGTPVFNSATPISSSAGFKTAFSAASASSSAPTFNTATVSSGALISSAPTATSASSSADLLPNISAYNFAQLEEILNKWNVELEEQGKLFLAQATQVNALDKFVLKNGNKIAVLDKKIGKVKSQQRRLDQELDFITAQHRELEDFISPLEKELINVSMLDWERSETYQSAENLDTQLKQVSEDLKEIIDHLNETSKAEASKDPVVSIGRILNIHMNTLQWIDESSAEIGVYLDQISKMHELHRRDNERSFHLTYE